MKVPLGDHTTTRFIVGTAALGGMAAGALWTKSVMSQTSHSHGSCCHLGKSSMASAAENKGLVEVFTKPVELRSAQKTFLSSVGHFMKSVLLLPFTLALAFVKAIAKGVSFLVSPIAKGSVN